MGQPSLPKWRPQRTLIDLYNEKDQTPWYWRAAATLSALLIMIGFLIFPSAFKQQSPLTISSTSAIIAAIILLILGYALSLIASLICRSWIFQLDIIFVPCLSSSILGLINVLFSLSTHDKSLQWTPSSTVALVLSIVSSLVYTIIALLTFRKIYSVKARDAMHRYHSDSTDAMMPESELQRQQLLRLLLQQEDAKQQNPDQSQSTFKIDWPGNAERRSTIVTLRNLPRAARTSIGNRNGDNNYSGQDASPPPPLPSMHSLAQEASSVDPRFRPSHDIAALDEHTYTSSNNNYIEADIPGIVNTRHNSPPVFRSPPFNNNNNNNSLPQLQANGYPIEKPEIVVDDNDFQVEQPPAHQRPEYHMVVDNQDTTRGRDQYRMLNNNSNNEQGGQQQRTHNAATARSQSRESRRMEIELADRGRDGGNKKRGQELEGVEVIGRIRRVETDGWGRR